MSEKIADVIKETENNKADRQEQYFFRTDQLTVGYDGKPLIREINIQLNKGEILTLIGPNGAGKSTILKSNHKTAFPDQRNGISGTGTDEPDDQQGSVKKTGCSTYRAHATGAYDL